MGGGHGLNAYDAPFELPDGWENLIQYQPTRKAQSSTYKDWTKHKTTRKKIGDMWAILRETFTMHFSVQGIQGMLPKHVALKYNIPTPESIASEIVKSIPQSPLAAEMLEYHNKAERP
jgi:hypothetical protein